MVRRNNWINYGILAAGIAAGIAGIVRESQGLILLAMRVRTSMDWCRPMTL